MFKRKRNLRKLKHQGRKLRGIIVLFLIILLASFFAGVSYYFLVLSKKNTVLYVSPLASVKGLTTDANQSHIEKLLKEKHIRYQSIEPDDETYMLMLQDDQQVVFSAKKDITVQISSLQFILSRLTMEGKEFSRLDLRFEKPVIVLK
ncbi:MAG: hypothetical protein AAB553_05330 [Patescibacteria group bacterium]